MAEILKSYYWSKGDAFLLPLTGLKKSEKFPIKSYLFWGENSIRDYRLTLKFIYKREDFENFVKHCRRVIFPPLDREGYLIETHDVEDGTIMVLDISDWGNDIDMFLEGKYSKMSRIAKDAIIEYHSFYDKGLKIPIEISVALEPRAPIKALGNKSGIEYAAENYGLPLAELKKVGELGSMYKEEEETLNQDV